MRIKLGMKVRDRISGYTGICDHAAEYWYSAPRVGITPPVGADGKTMDTLVFDEVQCEILDEKPLFAVAQVPDPMFVYGQEVKDTISGFRGIVVGRAIYINGCSCVCVQPKEINRKDGQPVKSNWINEKQLVTVGKVLKPAKKASTGGPNVSAVRSNKSL